MASVFYFVFITGIRYILENYYNTGMGKRGPKPYGKVKIEWSPAFAYGLGLIASDGCLSPDGRHINFTSKDLELVQRFLEAFNIQVAVGMKSRGRGAPKQYYLVQFSDVLFYNFLLGIGLSSNKSKTIKEINLPPGLFFDFFTWLI